MTVLSIILGVLMILCGISCMFTPLITFMDAGYFIVIMLIVYGIIGLVRSISFRRFGTIFAFSILSLIFGIALLFFPKLMLLTDGVLIYLTAAWFVIQGFVSIITSVSITRRLGSSVWIFQLIIGIIAVLLGCYSFFHPAMLAVSIGYLIGFYFIEAGISTIVFASNSK